MSYNDTAPCVDRTLGTEALEQWFCCLVVGSDQRSQIWTSRVQEINQ